LQVNFGGGQVEFFGQAGQEGLESPALTFERLVAGEVQADGASADDHWQDFSRE
jgi:hypothetical protein